MRTILAVSVGCPSGVGPEVAVAGAARVAGAACVLVGDERIVRRAAAIVRVPQRRIVRVADDAGLAALAASEATIGVWAGAAPIDPEEAPHGAPTRAAGAAQLAWIDEALALVRARKAAALVTGPVSKHAIASSGAGARARRFRGHTEHLAEALGAREVVMAFWSEELTTALATTHLRLAKVPRAVTPEAVGAATFHVARLAAKLRGRAPRIAIASLNPHAGEGGLLGDEETTRIEPGIALARRRLSRSRLAAELVGPLGAESALRLARAGEYDAVVCMYHDQATIPMKLVGFGEAVNVTLGLPIVRTSVDHGTGYDRAGKGTADPRGMRAAVDLATRLVR